MSKVPDGYAEVKCKTCGEGTGLIRHENHVLVKTKALLACESCTNSPDNGGIDDE